MYKFQRIFTDITTNCLSGITIKPRLGDEYYESTAHQTITALLRPSTR